MSHVVREFRRLFMNEVVEAEKLPDRHLYADEMEDDIQNENESEINIDDVPIQIDASARLSFEEFLGRLIASAKVFGQLILAKTGDGQIDRHLRNLRMIKAGQTYGFLMHLIVGNIERKTLLNVLKLTENFVLRRHICRERSNETEALFSRLCSVDPLDPVAAVRAAYRESCPTDEKFREEFTTAAFTSNIIDRARYCLEQLELLGHGKHDELAVLGSSDVHVEHIIPQKIKTKRAKEEFGDWVTYLGPNAESHHPKMVSRIGNLTLFAGQLNITASNNPFAAKKNAYKESSIRITNGLCQMSAFKFKHLVERSNSLAELAVKRWPAP
ncbi:hypothetical protein ABAC402_11555 [Asticcacaulis sp. AC402]|nr:hypothetical protein ABAC402_11555 [Asticcacaulis sp. AC402]